VCAISDHYFDSVLIMTYVGHLHPILSLSSQMSAKLAADRVFLTGQ
jgi:hypothetical protein